MWPFKSVPDIDRLKSEKDINGLTKALRYKEANIRAKAADALGKIGDREAVGPLIQALQDTDQVRVKAIDALGRLQDHRSIDALTQLLSSATPSIRGDTVRALGEIKSQRVVQYLLDAMDDSDQSVRANAARSLTRLYRNGVYSRDVFTACVPETRIRLVAVLKEDLEDNDFQVRLETIKALVAIGDDETLRSLARFLADDNSEVRLETAKAMAKLGEIAPLVDYVNKTKELFPLEACKALMRHSWQPDVSRAGAFVRIISNQVDHCSELGSVAIIPLLVASDFLSQEAGKIKLVLDRIGQKVVEDLVKEQRDPYLDACLEKIWPKPHSQRSNPIGHLEGSLPQKQSAPRSEGESTIFRQEKFVAGYIFEGKIGGPLGGRRAKEALVEFDKHYPGSLIPDRCEIVESPDNIMINILYYTQDTKDPLSLGRKFSEIARRNGL